MPPISDIDHHSIQISGECLSTSRKNSYKINESICKYFLLSYNGSPLIFLVSFTC